MTIVPEPTPGETRIEINTISIPDGTPEYTSLVNLSINVGKHSTTGAAADCTSAKATAVPDSAPTTTTAAVGSIPTTSVAADSIPTSPTAAAKTTSTTTSKPSVTIGIPDFIPEFTTELSDQFTMGQHSPTSLPTPLALTYIDPSGGVSVVPTHGPTMSFAPDARISIIYSTSADATATRTTTATPTAGKMQKIQTHKTHKTQETHKTQKTHKTKTYHSTKTRASHTPKPPKGKTHFIPTKKPTQTLEPRGQDYTIPGCTLSSSILTTTTAANSLAPSTLFRLPRRSPGHYIDQDALRRVVDVRPVETSLGTKDSANNVVYDESTAATPWNPWGAQRGSGQVYDRGINIPRVVGVVVGIVIGGLIVILGTWCAIRVMLNKRAKRRALAFRKVTEEIQH
jgi:hypothetical protein